MPIWEDGQYDQQYSMIAPAYQGWTRAQALADFNEARGGDLSKLPGQYGDTLRTSSGAGKPSIDLQGTYDKLFKTPEIDTLTGAVNGVQNQILERQKKLADAEAIINDNPFYSEGTRVGRVAKLQDRAQRDIDTISKQGQLYQNQLATAKAGAETQMNLALKQYDISRQEYQDNMNKFNTLLSSGAIANASPQDIAQLSISTGMSPSMINAIIKTQKDQASANAVKPQVLTSTDDNGNVTFSVIDANSGKIINQSSLGQIDKKTKQTGSGASAAEKKEEKERTAFYSAIDAGLKKLQSGTSWGQVWNMIRAQFPDVPAEMIDSLLDKSYWSQPGAWQQYKSSQKVEEDY